MSTTTVKKTFPILKLSCASCASSSQSILSHVEGVSNVSVNFANATAFIEYNPSVTNPSKFKTAVQSIGYDLMIEESESAQENLEEAQKKN